MTRKKERTVCMAIAIGAVIITFGFIVFGVMYEGRKKPDDGPESGQTADVHESNESVETSGFSIPPISSADKGTLNTENRPDVDVGSMTRNPEAEVIGSHIEYETKKAG